MDKNSAIQLIKQCEIELKDQFSRLDDIALYNQEKVLDAYKNQSIQARHMFGTTGYGYDDIGRDTLCRLYADIFHAESAIVSPNIVSGTHALTLMLFGVLRPGDKLLAISGMPYDTLTDVILAENKGSLRDFGVKFDKIDLKTNPDLTPEFDREAIKIALENEPIKAVFLARSRGYSLRQAISVEKVGEIIAFVKKISPKTLVLVDNCYGEFVEKIEPTDVGADLIAGSLIKNIGGGIAPTGGYVCGRQDLIDLIAGRVTSPSVGMEVGSYTPGYRLFYQGLFNAPHVVNQALKVCLLFAQTLTELGYDVLPKLGDNIGDIVCSVKLGSAQRIIDFCKAVQSSSPVDAFVSPEPWEMPGYNDKVIMAAGCFVQGASIELSCDGPIREPYIVYLQGGLTLEHGIIALQKVLENLGN